MDQLHGLKTIKIKSRRPWLLIAGATVLILAVSCGLMYLIITGKTRRGPTVSATTITSTSTASATTTLELVTRRLDGVLVPTGQEAYAPRAVMVDNMASARPLSGISSANVAIEAPVEGGITRLMLLFDATTTVDEVGPVRSARPYFVDWAAGWKAAYFHVGGSPDALDKLKTLTTSTVLNVDEIARGDDFWRTDGRPAPHQVLTSKLMMDQAAGSLNYAEAALPVAWQFKDEATSTERGMGGSFKVTYGSTYTVTWKYDPDTNAYVRQQSSKTQLDAHTDLRVEAKNVVVIKTDASVLDDKLRLKLRTTGGGDALLYRDGNKYTIRWTRSANEPMRFAGMDGSDVMLDRGKTWIEVTTDDRVFAGI